jgi:hypothetical protein
VQRRELDIILDGFDHSVIDQNGLGILFAPVYYAMPDAFDLIDGVQNAQSIV